MREDFGPAPDPVTAMVEWAVAGEPHTITRDGRPVAVVVGWDDWDDWDDWQELDRTLSGA
jgi:prevent-host-death family protein